MGMRAPIVSFVAVDFVVVVIDLSSLAVAAHTALAFAN